MIRIYIYSRVHHLKQILTGFHIFAKQSGEKMIIIDCSKNNINTIACMVYIRGVKIVYDVQDGYQDVEAMGILLEKADYYFKRSYSEIDNKRLGERIKNFDIVKKIRPLGFNYDVTYQWCPLNDGKPWKEFTKRILGYNDTPNAYFRPEVIEGYPDYRGDVPKIFFQTRLWDIPDDYPEWKKDQWEWINQTRLSLIKELKAEFGNQFEGGLVNNSASRMIAPNFILSDKESERKNYIEKMKRADICIGTTGLHMSIGGKTGEYIAAARAIVHEKFYYTVTGDFLKDNNYLEFNSVEQCIENVYSLINNPSKIYDIEKANYDYYKKYLKPEVLIENSLISANIL